MLASLSHGELGQVVPYYKPPHSESWAAAAIPIHVKILYDFSEVEV